MEGTRNLAEEMPDFTVLPGRASAEHHASGIIIAPSLAYMEQGRVLLGGRATL
jgi:hypothetical protein